mmetsp:Transcript_15173/g.20595  ORF Transcript_15173/g.20595 Transcript_15173/m.20595 type:complete len:194 (+) Transcript_15173:959-1540(+)|eukprot:CAMPEP_0185566862 /NCGR_PEP_ID=MMETSP0434-20130131/283_1 /TAXON_ID=626734 ORGANISM="Favella taraikaensis, Strain Fe Narragansett Bay" /NCGR_SAMPLE_ID=MMETSP0434 /ASSEMBLY_ACC=CAM_ASM_000379 /LENGTH=193 /DNA_ID=CAMNT_0028180913 /DNA_START=962 /DNA_END=1543 /DNA_ORIENTATION=-
MESTDPVEILEKVRASLNARGVRTIRGMGRSFRIIDDNGDRKIDMQEFYWGLKDLGAEVTKREAQLLLDHLDLNKDGVVSYDEFLFGIRGAPNETRMAIIDAAFAKFDSDGSGTVTSADLRTVYDTSQHPKVISGEMTDEEVFVQFLTSFGDRNGDGVITRQEWNDYYAAVSSNIDNDSHFVALMRNAWKIDQ